MRRPGGERVASWSLERFGSSGLALLVDSEVLGEQVIFAADNAPSRTLRRLLEASEAPIAGYRAAELQKIVRAGLTRSQVRTAHEIKRALHGRITSIE